MVTATLGANDGQIGQRRYVDGKEYVLVYNGGGASAMVGAGVVLNSAATNYTVTVSAATSADLVIGVVHTATLTTGAYGWVVRKGITPVQMLGGSSASVAARGLIEIAANGLWAPVSNTTGNAAAGCGLALAAITSGTSGNAFVSCYG
jgi:hypothetical protein